MYDPTASRQLFLTQDWDAAWQAVVKPWLSCSNGLKPGYVVVPTRGQARALRLRMAQEGVVSIGARFVTPGLIRRLPVPGLRPAGVVPDRAILEFAFTLSVAEACERGGLDSDEEGLARSLLSRPSDPLDDWDDLLRAGLDEKSFPHPFVRRLFRLLRGWLLARGFSIPHAEASPRDEKGGSLPPGGTDRVLIYGFGADCWRDGPDLFRLSAATQRVTAVIPFPSFSGKPLEEEWAGQFESALGTEALSLPDQAEQPWGCLARSWVLNEAYDGESAVACQVPILVGEDSAAEVALIFHQIVAWLDRPQVRIAVVFPASSPAVADLAGRLRTAGIRYCDEIATTGAPSGEIALLKAFLAYQSGGCRLEELWTVARLLRSNGDFALTAGQSRDWIERAFDACQSHRVADALKSSEVARSSRSAVMAKLVEDLGFWPEQLSVRDGVAGLETCARRWGLEVPERLVGLDRLIAVSESVYPREAVVELLIRSLPERAPRQDLIRDDFAPVVLTTRKRATAQVWSHVLFAGSNAEAWPGPVEETFWLGDSARREINRKAGEPMALHLAEDSAMLERLSCLELCNNTVDGVAFSACLRVNDGTETGWSPHPWLERILLQRSRMGQGGEGPGNGGGFSRQYWENLARRAPRQPATDSDRFQEWAKLWRRRRDPWLPFDAWFYCHEPMPPSGRRWAARALEAGFRDPVHLWYDGVLRLRRIPESPLIRSRRKELGSLVHRLLALSIRGDAQPGGIQPRPSLVLCRGRLERLLTDYRQSRPDDAYWRSFCLELSALTRNLLERVLGPESPAWVGAEVSLPQEARIRTTYGDLPVSGRIDLIETDRPEWAGASMTISDFKTGSDDPLNAARMGERGQSLQLGVYLKAALELGASDVMVRMVQPEQEKDSSLVHTLLDPIQPAFDRLGQQILSGRFGQRTPDRSRFSFGFEAPLACVPIPLAVLERKTEVTFPSDEGASTSEGGEP